MIVDALTFRAIIAVVIMVVVVVAVAAVRAVVIMTVELLFIDVRDDVMIGLWSDVVIGVVVALAFILPALLYFLKMLSGVVVESLTVDFSVGVLPDVNVNVSTAVTTALEFRMSIS